MASLFKQNGRYYLQFTNSNRTPRCKKIPLRTAKKRVAERAAKKLEEAFATREFNPWKDDPDTFQPKSKVGTSSREALDQYLGWHRKKGHTENTIDHYENTIGYFIEDTADIDSLSADEIEEWVHQSHLATATKDRNYRAIRAFMNWCYRNELIASNPVDRVARPKLPKSLPKPIPPADLRRLCAAIERDYNRKLGEGLCVEDEVIWQKWAILWACYTGMRISEIGRLKWKHTNRSQQLVHIPITKSREEQTIPLFDKSEAILEEVGEGEADEYVFRPPNGEKYARSITSFRNNLSRHFREYRDDLGIDKRLTFHSTRHTFCSRLAQAGENAATIKSLARHSDISTSMKYIHLSSKHLRSTLESVFK